MPEFEIKSLKIADLKPAEYNPRQLSEKQFKDLQKSFKNLGTLEPAVINQYPGRENVIISGHQRLKVAESLGMVEYPCYEVKFPPKKEKEANIRMNKNTGGWDMDSLANNFDLPDLVDWGFEDFELGIGGGVDPAGGSESGGQVGGNPKMVACPHCGKEFDVNNVIGNHEKGAINV